MVDQTIRVGVVGAGANAVRRHIPNLQALAGVEIVSVCNRSRASSAQVAEEWGIPRIADDWRTLVADSDVDAVVIGTWPNLHHPVTLAALHAGKHVLVEARMAMNASEAHDMWEAARARPHLVAQVVPSPLSFEVDATIKRLLAENALGSLIDVELAARSGSAPDATTPLHWRQDAARSGMNIMSLGIWYESMMRWVGAATEVFATGSVTVPWRPDESGTMHQVQIPDHLVVIARLAGGAHARFVISDVTGPAVNRATLWGTEGRIRFESGALFGSPTTSGNLAPIEIPAEEAGRWRVEEEFVGAIRGEEPVRLTDFATGFAYMEFTEAVWRSMQGRKPIDLPLSIRPLDRPR